MKIEFSGHILENTQM